MFCLEVLIYKRLQMWRHNDVTGRNEYLISTWSESTVPWVYSLQFLFTSTHYSWRYERKYEWVFFFWTQCRLQLSDALLAFGTQFFLFCLFDDFMPQHAELRIMLWNWRRWICSQNKLETKDRTWSYRHLVIELSLLLNLLFNCSASCIVAYLWHGCAFY